MKFPEGVAYESILEGRQTEINFGDNAQSTVDRDDWFNQPAREMDEFWIGKTLFKIQRPQVEVQDVAARPAAAPRDDELMEVPIEVERTVPAVPSTPGGRPAPKTPGGSSALKRRKPTRQLQRGFWQEVEEPEAIGLLNETMEYAEEIALEGWGRLDLSSDLGERWKSHESAQSEVQLILISSKAVRMRKPQPFAGPAEVPMRRSYLLLQSGKVLATSWEDWCKMAPSSQVRPLVAKSRKLYVVAFGRPLGEGLLEEKDDRFVAKEEERQRKWQVLPRELKLAIKRIHCNLGHASVPAMLRALRMSKASETAIKAVRLFRCDECPRLHEHPKEARPSKLPMVHDFNVQIGVDVIVEKDSDGASWSWLSVLCQGTCFHVCALLPQTHQNPSSSDVLEAMASQWLSWAGYPERGIIADRAKYFLSTFVEEFDAHGCLFSAAAKASPWQIGQVERHNDLWKTTLKRVVWTQQVSGRDDMLVATAAVNMAKNSMSRQHGFSPYQWIMGRDLRLPAALSDESEVTRSGMMALDSRFQIL